jgi:hypothetical protein
MPIEAERRGLANQTPKGGRFDGRLEREDGRDVAVCRETSTLVGVQ